MGFLHSNQIYDGRASDKYKTKDSGFYNPLEQSDQVMADRGFQIKEELLIHFCTFDDAPRARMKSQMTFAEVKKTIDVANFRIYVERVINPFKSFRILTNTLVVSLLQHIDCVSWTCTVLCNLKPKFICSQK